MNRERRKDIFEAVGLAAIVGSLLFLALEVRQANLSTRIAARDQVTQGVIDQLGDIIDPQVLSVAYQKSGTDEALTDLEEDQLNIYFLRRLWNFERIYYLYRADVVSDQEWRGFEKALKNSLDESGSDSFWSRNQRAWRTARRFMSEEFVEYVDSEVYLVE